MFEIAATCAVDSKPQFSGVSEMWKTLWSHTRPFAETAVIGVHHPKWDERPLLIVQLEQGKTATREDILKFMEGKIAKWWMPDDVTFVDGVPHTATGKILKAALRDQFKSYSFPNSAG